MLLYDLCTVPQTGSSPCFQPAQLPLVHMLMLAAVSMDVLEHDARKGISESLLPEFCRQRRKLVRVGVWASPLSSMERKTRIIWIGFQEEWGQENYVLQNNQVPQSNSIFIWSLQARKKCYNLIFHLNCNFKIGIWILLGQQWSWPLLSPIDAMFPIYLYIIFMN